MTCIAARELLIVLCAQAIEFVIIVYKWKREIWLPLELSLHPGCFETWGISASHFNFELLLILEDF